MYAERVVSGMRPTGPVTLGHLHGLLADWIRLQHEFPCLFFVADWHALAATHDEPTQLRRHVLPMVAAWLAAGLDPNQCTIFLQSRTPEHAELHLLLSSMTPLGWLERVPSYKEALENAASREGAASYGLLGYPLLMAADILLYRADRVPVSEDQTPHLEFARELARRFNHLYGREPGFEDKAREAIKKLGSKRGKLYEVLRTRFQQEGDKEALEQAQAMLEEMQHLSVIDRERLFGYLEGAGKMILVEPEALVSESRFFGAQGAKKACDIALCDDAETVTRKIRGMPTDPARMRRGDIGDPQKCPLWSLHRIYSDDACRQWASAGCQSAGIGCLECKQPVIDAVQKELAPIRERIRYYEENPEVLHTLLAEGGEKARDLARETLREVREAMGLDYS